MLKKPGRAPPPTPHRQKYVRGWVVRLTQKEFTHGFVCIVCQTKPVPIQCLNALRISA